MRLRKRDDGVPRLRSAGPVAPDRWQVPGLNVQTTSDAGDGAAPDSVFVAGKQPCPLGEGDAPQVTAVDGNKVQGVQCCSSVCCVGWQDGSRLLCHAAVMAGSCDAA